MAVASERLAAPALSAPARWRGRPAQVGLVVVLMLAAFALWRGEYPWPSWLTWTQLPEQARRPPGLAARRAHRGGPQLHLHAVRRVPRAGGLARHRTDRRARVADLDRHRRLRRAAGLALRRLARGPDRGRRVRLVRADGPVGAERADAGADARGGHPLALHRRADRHLGRPQRARAPHDHARARRDADRARVRLPDAGRDPLLGRPGRRGHLHDDLRHPAGRAHHGARHPGRDGGHGRGVEGARRDADADALQGPAPARAQAAPARGQPDDHVRALARRDRRPDRRARARRRRHERPLLERRAGHARGRRDRHHGDRARPLHRGDRRAHGPDAPPPHGRRPRPRAPVDAALPRPRSS